MAYWRRSFASRTERYVEIEVKIGTFGLLPETVCSRAEVACQRLRPLFSAKGDRRHAFLAVRWQMTFFIFFAICTLAPQSPFPGGNPLHNGRRSSPVRQNMLFWGVQGCKLANAVLYKNRNIIIIYKVGLPVCTLAPQSPFFDSMFFFCRKKWS